LQNHYFQIILNSSFRFFAELHLDSEESTGLQQIDIHRNLIKVPVYDRQPATRQQAILMVRRLELRLKRITAQVNSDEIVAEDVLEVSVCVYSNSKNIRCPLPRFFLLLFLSLF
jgi:hypothetical protein